MTKEEYIKQIQALPPEKIQIISDSFYEASLLINKTECALHDTPLCHIDFPLHESYGLWLIVYQCHKMFYQCLTPKP